MRYWLDTEFIEDGRTIDLLSIGMVAEDGREYYAEMDGAPLHRANAWVRQNVLPHLSPCLSDAKHIPGGANRCTCPVFHPWQIAAAIQDFCDPDQYGKPEFWGYFADYDWVIFCQLYGAMIDLPNTFPMYCWDLKQEMSRLGISKPLIEGCGPEHHALSDARWNKAFWEYLKTKGL